MDKPMLEHQEEQRLLLAKLAAEAGSGWARRIAYYTIAVWIWAGAAIFLLLKFLCSPFSFFPSSKLAPEPELREPFRSFYHLYIVANGVRLHAVSPRHQRDRPLMLLLHGFPETWYSWRHIIVAFKDQYDVVAIDMRGYNDSEKPWGRENYALDVLAKDVKEAIYALGHKSAIVVAHDWGGVVAWVVAALFPQAVDQLVVLAAPHLGLARVHQTLSQLLYRSWYVFLFRAAFLPELLLLNNNGQGALDIVRKAGVAGRAPAPGALTPLDEAHYRAAVLKPGAATCMLNYYRALFDFVITSSNGKVHAALAQPLPMPVCALWADGDRAVGLYTVAGLELLAPLSELHVLQNCSHWIAQDQPGEAIRLIGQFLQSAAEK